MTIPKLIIHGGAGNLEGTIGKENEIRESLRIICNNTYDKLLNSDAYSAVVYGVSQLENNQLFNAGTGSKLQLDGHIRMSAAIMDGKKNRFSGVINIQNIKNPILVAHKLQLKKFSVIAGDEATKLAEEMGFSFYNPMIKIRRDEHVRALEGTTGTVGVVALDKNNNIVAGTSTGGIGGETPGRVSDSPTVAGTYANKFSGISATGIGEQIVNYGLAVKIATRIEDGVNLQNAIDKTMINAKELNYKFGLIAISINGDICLGNTTDLIFYAWRDGKNTKVF